MTRSRRLQSLRGTLVLVLVLSAVLVSSLTATALVLAARANIYEARQNVLLTQFRNDTDTRFNSLSEGTAPEQLEYEATNFSGTTAIVLVASGKTYGKLSRADIPEVIRSGWHEYSGTIRYLRTTRNGEPVFFVGTVTSTLTNDPGRRVAVVTMYTLRSEREQIDHLVTTAIVIGVGAVLLAIAVGIWLGSVLTRPISRLADRARRLTTDHDLPAVRSRFRDVDDVGRALHESATTLTATIAELRRREGHARRLVSDVAHELRTPLTSMVAVADILDELEDADPGDRATAIGITRRGTERLTALVSEILELSRMDAGVTGAHPEYVHVHTELRALVDLVAPTSDVTITCSPDLEAHTDPSLLRKIVSNLVTNAVRHGIAPITITAEAESKRLRVAVSDGGTGLAAADADRVFDRFTVLDSGRRDPDSTGIGLAIAREAARLLGGELVVDIHAATTTFVLTVPAA